MFSFAKKFLSIQQQEPPSKNRVYFQPNTNKENKELIQMLNSMKPPQQEEAMKQIIASMTLGKDVSCLFTYVINCIRTTSLELKKLIYLYIINYAKVKPDLAILGIAAFTTDSKDPTNPIIRALAIRTMGCIQVEMVSQYLAEILSKSLRDEDSYVRKTAAMCVAKLYSSSPSTVIDNCFIDTLMSIIIEEENEFVIANIVTTLIEVSTLNNEKYISKLKYSTIQKMLRCLTNTNEWCQAIILDAILLYIKDNNNNHKHNMEILEGIIPRLTHSNETVVINALRVVVKILDHMDNIDKINLYQKKLASTIESLMLSSYEIKYIILRALYSLVQKRPGIFENKYKCFFIEYNEPIYVKIEKVEILYKLCNDSNYENIFKEFKTYALSEFNSDLIKKSIRYMGYITLKHEKILPLCVSFINELFDSENTPSETALNEASNIMCDIIRKYKGISLQLLKYINSDLILNDISDSDSKSSLIYLLGEFCKEIKNSTQYLTELIELFDNETTNSNIKLQLLTSIVKNYVNKPDEGENITKLILKKGAEELSDPDIRDRAYLYWRILESEPDIAKEMMNFKKKTFEFNEDNYYEDDLIDDMLLNFTNVSSVYHIHSENLQEKIIVNDIITQQQQPKTQNKQETNDDEFNEVIDLSDNTNTNNNNNNNQTTSKSNEIDLLGLDLSNKEQTTTEQPTQTKKGGLMNDLMSIFG